MTCSSRSNTATSTRPARLFDHIGLEVTDLERSARFYDALMFAIGGRGLVEGPGGHARGVRRAPLRVGGRRARPRTGGGPRCFSAAGAAARAAAAAPAAP